jgi:hypothetical protein
MAHERIARWRANPAGTLAAQQAEQIPGQASLLDG